MLLYARGCYTVVWHSTNIAILFMIFGLANILFQIVTALQRSPRPSPPSPPCSFLPTARLIQELSRDKGNEDNWREVMRMMTQVRDEHGERGLGLSHIYKVGMQSCMDFGHSQEALQLFEEVSLLAGYCAYTAVRLAGTQYDLYTDLCEITIRGAHWEGRAREGRDHLPCARRSCVLLYIMPQGSVLWRVDFPCDSVTFLGLLERLELVHGFVGSAGWGGGKGGECCALQVQG